MSMIKFSWRLVLSYCTIFWVLLYFFILFDNWVGLFLDGSNSTLWFSPVKDTLYLIGMFILSFGLLFSVVWNERKTKS